MIGILALFEFSLYSTLINLVVTFFRVRFINVVMSNIHAYLRFVRLYMNRRVGTYMVYNPV